MSLIEIHESLPLIIVTFLQLIPVLNHVNIFESVVVGVYIVFVTTFTYVEYALVLSIEEENGWSPCLPVYIDILGHDALYHCITHIEIIEVVASVAHHYRLEISNPLTLVWKELIVKTLLSKTLVGIETHRL